MKWSLSSRRPKKSVGHETLVAWGPQVRGCGLKGVTWPKADSTQPDWTADPRIQAGRDGGILVNRAFSPQAWRGGRYLFHLKCLCNRGQRKQLQVIFLLGSNYPTIVLRAPVSFCTCTCGWTLQFLHRTVLETLLAALWVICQSEEMILPPKPGLRAAGPGACLPNPTAGLLLCPRVEWGLGGPQVPGRGGALVEIPFLLRGVRCGCSFGFQRDFGKK